jgi:PAS domain S-box-containing protein
MDEPTTPHHSGHSDQVGPTIRSPRALTSGLVAGFVAIVIVLTATHFIALASLRNVYETSTTVAHSNAVNAGLEGLLATLVDAETGERGFVITGRTGYLEPYDRARTTLSSEFAKLRTLVADNAEQQQDLDRLSAASERKLAELAETVRLRKDSGFAAAQAALFDNVGKRIMDDMRVIVARMRAREDALLTTRTAQAEQSYRSARTARFVTTGLALLALVGLFYATRRFGTERVRAADNAERLRVTLASIGDAVIATDEQGRVTRLNTVAEALTGWTEADAVGKRLEEVFVIINEQTRRPAENPIGKVLRERVIVGLANHTVLIAKDGREIPVDDSAAPIKSAEGHVTGAVMVFRDVSERRRVERERTVLAEAERLARTDAEHANSLKDQFLAMVSHELRTPLNAVLGWADILQRGDIDRTKRERALSAIYTNAARQVQLIDELLDVSRIISGKLRLERAAIDLAEIVRTAVEVVQPSADRKRIDLALETDPSLRTFYADPGRLQQIVVNLLSNAIKFTPDGGGVHMRVRRVDSLVEISVTDTGQGIPSDFLPLVFEPFRQADGSLTRRHGGLGLGLSIVKHLVEAHGGTVCAESAGESQGSTFIVRLPTVAVIADETDADIPTSASELSVPPQPVAGCLEAISVLVVDDDADGRELVAATLEHYGAEVITAASAPEALDLLQTKPVNVLLADIAMPDEDGYSLIRRLRTLQSPQRAAIPAAALTSFARDEDRQHAIQAGFQVHLAKPIDTRSLVQAVVNLAQGIQTQ